MPLSLLSLLLTLLVAPSTALRLSIARSFLSSSTLYQQSSAMLMMTPRARAPPSPPQALQHHSSLMAQMTLMMTTLPPPWPPRALQHPFLLVAQPGATQTITSPGLAPLTHFHLLPQLISLAIDDASSSATLSCLPPLLSCNEALRCTSDSDEASTSSFSNFSHFPAPGHPFSASDAASLSPPRASRLLLLGQRANLAVNHDDTGKMTTPFPHRAP